MRCVQGSAAIFCWDMNGSPEGRAVWAQHVEDLGPGAMSGVVYVIDATAPYTLHLAQRELERLLSFPNLESKCPVLIIANKHDVADVNPAMSCHAIADALNLRALSRRWCVQECSALLGTGVEQALDWLCGAEAAKPRRHEANLLAEESARVLRSEVRALEQHPGADSDLTHPPALPCRTHSWGSGSLKQELTVTPRDRDTLVRAETDGTLRSERPEPDR